MIKQMLDSLGVEELARRARDIPESRRRQLEREFVSGHPNFDSGLFAGLGLALQRFGPTDPQRADELKELTTVLAGHVVLARIAAERADAELADPALRAALDEEIEGLKSGRIRGIPAEEFLQEVEALVASMKSSQRNGPTEEAEDSQPARPAS